MPDDIKEVDTSELESLKEQLNKLNAELEYQKSEAKKAFEKRDAYKKQIEEAEKKALEEQGKYKELYEVKEKEFSEVAKTVEQLKVERDSALKKLTDFENSQREELYKQLPNEEAVEIGKNLGLEELRKYVNLLGIKRTDKNVNPQVKKVASKTTSAWEQELKNIKI